MTSLSKGTSRSMIFWGDLFESRWMDDNRARALVNLKRYSEAVAIWQKLKICGISELEKISSEMLERNADRGREQRVLIEIEEIMNDGKEIHIARDNAIAKIIDAVLENPEQKAWQTKLNELASKQEDNTQHGETEFPELYEHRQKLLGFNKLISVVESRLAKKQQASPS